MTSNFWKIWYINDKLTQFGHLNPIMLLFLPLHHVISCFYKRGMTRFLFRTEKWAFYQDNWESEMIMESCSLQISQIKHALAQRDIPAIRSSFLASSEEIAMYHWKDIEESEQMFYAWKDRIHYIRTMLNFRENSLNFLLF